MPWILSIGERYLRSHADLHLPELRQPQHLHGAHRRLHRAARAACAKCGFGFLFELLDDYYPAPNAAFFVCDQQARADRRGRGAASSPGLGDHDVIGRPVQDVLGLEFEDGEDHIGTALEWGVRVLDKPVTVHAEGDRPEPAKADIFPAYDDDGGLLLVLTPQDDQPQPQPRRSSASSRCCSCSRCS